MFATFAYMTLSWTKEINVASPSFFDGIKQDRGDMFRQRRVANN